MYQERFVDSVLKMYYQDMLPTEEIAKNLDCREYHVRDVISADSGYYLSKIHA